jgi:outer membrane protein TolC
VNEARAALLPWIGLRTDYSVIDKDRAEALSGIMPEKLWTGSAALSQLIYSDRAWLGYTVEKHLQESRFQDVEATRLDIIQAAATAYLDVLKAMTIEQIQKENLILTRENLSRARIRVSAGIAGPDEVYRWEAEIATAKGSVLQAESRTLAAHAEMNRILNRPLMEEFSIGNGSESAAEGILVDDWIVDYLQNPRTLRKLGEQLLEESIINAPEIKGVDALIAAAERTVSGSKRNFLIPDLSINGDVTQRFDYSGAGSERPPGNTVDDTNWSVGATASIPLLTGGERIATLNRTKEELARVRIERSALSQRVEQRALIDVYLIRASFPAIGLSRAAVEASEKNLDLVSESYAQGIKSIIDLIDAQNKYYVAKQSQANATFGFAADLIALQRSIGKFYMLLGEGERETFRDKVEANK